MNKAWAPPCLYASLFSGWAVHMDVSDQPHGREVNTPAARQAQQESSRTGRFVSM